MDNTEKLAKQGTHAEGKHYTICMLLISTNEINVFTLHHHEVINLRINTLKQSL
jgi:hypothetical protein